MMKIDLQTLTVSLGGVCVGALLSFLFWKGKVHLLEEAGGAPSSVRSGQRDSAEETTETRSLKSVLATEPSLWNVAVLWQKTEDLSFGELRRHFLEAGRSANPNRRTKEFMAVLLEQMMRLDRQSTLTLVRSLGAEQKGVLLPELAAMDAAGAIEIYAGLNDPDRAAFPVGSLLEVLGAVDLEGAVAVVEMVDPHERAAAYGSLLSGLSARDPSSALALLKTLSDVELAGGLSDLKTVGRIAALDPVEVARLMERLPMNGTTAWRYAEIAEVWAAQDPGSALAWANSLQFEAVRSKALTSLYAAWAVEDRERAFEALAEIKDESLRGAMFGEMVASVITEVFKNDIEGAANWARELEGGRRSTALGLLASEVAQQDPELATKLIAEALEGRRGGIGGIVEDVAEAFAAHDPLAARQWASEVSAEWQHEYVVAGVAISWTASDPVAAAEWIGTLPPSSARNHAIYHLVFNIRSVDPASAFNWATRISGDAEKQNYLLKKSTERWAEVAPDEARAAINELELPPESLATLLRQVDEQERNR